VPVFHEPGCQGNLAHGTFGAHTYSTVRFKVNDWGATVV
jgi:hypothetical protein